MFEEKYGIKRPRSVTIIAGLFLFEGCLILVNSAVKGMLNPIGQHNVLDVFTSDGIDTSFFICMPLFFILGLNILNGKNWARKGGIILYLYSLGITGYLFFTESFVFILAMIIQIVLLRYLMKPHVKEYFSPKVRTRMAIQ